MTAEVTSAQFAFGVAFLEITNLEKNNKSNLPFLEITNLVSRQSLAHRFENSLL